MLEALKNGSGRGIAVQGMTSGQKLLSTVLAFTITALLIILSVVS
jgi:hypothetical protein